MTENEEIKEIDNLITWVNARRNAPLTLSDCGADVAIKVLSEWKQYRATGLKPSMIEDLKKSEKQAHKIAMENAMKLEEYEALGTMEELREAMEKQRAKKYKTIKPCKSVSYYSCPECDGLLSENQEYCEFCGQAIDFSEVEE